MLSKDELEFARGWVEKLITRAIAVGAAKPEDIARINEAFAQAALAAEMAERAEFLEEELRIGLRLAALAKCGEGAG